METLEEFVNGCIDYHNEGYSIVHEHVDNDSITRGNLTSFSCLHVETLVYNILTWCLQYNNISNFEIVKGDKRNGIPINNGGGTISVGVDWHVYVNGSLFMVIECKSRIDKGFLESTSFNFTNLKKHYDVVTIMASLEDGTSVDTLGFFRYSGAFDNIVVLCDGNRNPTKPIWRREHFKKINKNKLLSFINYINHNILI